VIPERHAVGSAGIRHWDADQQSRRAALQEGSRQAERVIARQDNILRFGRRTEAGTARGENYFIESNAAIGDGCRFQVPIRQKQGRIPWFHAWRQTMGRDMQDTPGGLRQITKIFESLYGCCFAQPWRRNEPALTGMQRCHFGRGLERRWR
jgi:hypothetical protein